MRRRWIVNEEDVRRSKGGDEEEMRRSWERNEEEMRRSWGGDEEEMRKSWGGDEEEMRRSWGGHGEKMRRRWGKRRNWGYERSPVSVVRILTCQTRTLVRINNTGKVFKHNDPIGADKPPNKNYILKTVECWVVYTLACTATKSGRCMRRSYPDLYCKSGQQITRKYIKIDLEI